MDPTLSTSHLRFGEEKRTSEHVLKITAMLGRIASFAHNGKRTKFAKMMEVLSRIPRRCSAGVSPSYVATCDDGQHSDVTHMCCLG